MIQSRSVPRLAPARWVGAAALLATALVAVAPSAGRAQSNNQTRQPPAGMAGLQAIAKGAKLMTYYGDLIPRDGYLIVPAKGDNRNFLGCDSELISVDEKQLKSSASTNCGVTRSNPGPIEAYVKKFETNGDVQIATQFGGETIDKNKWADLVKTFADTTGGQAGSNGIKAGHFVVFDKDEQGRFTTIYKPAGS